MNQGSATDKIFDSIHDLNTLEAAVPLLVLVLKTSVLNWGRCNKAAHTRTILHTRDAERPRTKYGIAIDDHDEYDRAFWREAVDEREV